MRHTWHVGLVVAREDVDRRLWPEIADFPQAVSLEIGWGDRNFYQDPNAGVGSAVRALFPGDSVLQVVGLPTPRDDSFPLSELVRMSVSIEGFNRLTQLIHNSYARATDGEVIRIGRSLYGDGYFYLAQEKYYFPKTCNVWVACLLRAAGVPITPRTAVSAGNLIYQLKAAGGRRRSVSQRELSDDEE